LKPRLSEERKYLYEERISIKTESGISEEDAIRQPLDEMAGKKRKQKLSPGSGDRTFPQGELLRYTRAGAFLFTFKEINNE
jgi:hypothetical protein